jgi:V/A-type H+-transporting ATPase subunit C
MKKYNSEDYIFASTYIRSREKYLLTQEKADRMLDSKTADDALRVLYELQYGEGLDEIPASEFEKLLALELIKTYDMVMSLVPDEEYFNLFLYPNDYHNIKVLLKAEFADVSSQDLLIGSGTVDISDLAENIQNRNFNGMREEMAKGIKEVIETFGATQDPQVIDLILDKACYKDMGIEVAKLKNKFIKGYVELKIATINSKSFIRAKEMNKSWDFFSKIYIEGGKVPERLFINNYDEPLEQFAERLGAFDLSAVLHEGVPALKETGRFTVLEKFCDNLLMDYVKESKYVPFGVEPLVSYIVAKESEIKTIRIIMAGKLAGLSTELIRERIRDTYA